MHKTKMKIHDSEWSVWAQSKHVPCGDKTIDFFDQAGKKKRKN